MTVQEALKTTLIDLNHRWNAAFNAGKAEEVTAFYDAEATLMPAGGEAVSGPAAILAFWQGLLAQGVHDHDIAFAGADIDGNLAVQRGRWRASAKNEAGQLQHFGGHVQLVYKRQADAQWKILTHIWN